MNTKIESYITSFPPETQERLLQIRSIFLKEVPDAQEDIKYQMPTLIWHGNLIHYAAFKNHIGVFPPGISAKRAIICAGGNDLKTLRVFPDQEEAIIYTTIQNIRQIIAELENKCEMIYVLTIPPIYSVPFYLKPLKSTKALLSSLDAINIRRITKRVQC